MGFLFIVGAAIAAWIGYEASRKSEVTTPGAFPHRDDSTGVREWLPPGAYGVRPGHSYFLRLPHPASSYRFVTISPGFEGELEKLGGEGVISYASRWRLDVGPSAEGAAVRLQLWGDDAPNTYTFEVEPPPR